MSTSTTPDQSMSLEEALAALQVIVEQLEQGNLPLAETIARFEEGSRLAELCQKLIDDAELRITVLTEDDDELDADDRFDDEDPTDVPF
ncbi:MAG TPA: exodeoxyribonuclease VII small subunit [Thermomicrobiales bacterium]|nr:exodeoxyribonuclease VII small subunit [Thermomicrobiales bacterium]